MGDLNCNFHNKQPECHTTRLENILQTFQLSQLIDEPARITNETSSLIDLFLTNNCYFIQAFILCLLVIII